MKSLDDMCDASVSMNNSLQRRKQHIENSSTEFDTMGKAISQREVRIDSSFAYNIQSPMISVMINSENEKQSLHFDSLTEENFHHAHLCHRNIEELPNINMHDIKRLKRTNIYTMQDLLGRYLIHDATDEFHTFLIKASRVSEAAASTITQLLYQWTRYNLDGTDDD